MRLTALILLICTLTGVSKAQEQTFAFGIQYRPLVPNEVFNGNGVDLANDTVRAVVSDKLGHAFGFIVRRNFTERWSLETGLNILRRNYWISAAAVDSAVSERFDLGMQTYEIPVQGLYYVRVSEQFYLNSAAGLSLNMFPTDHTKVSPERTFTISSKRRQWIRMSLIANVGVEYRTRNSGNFYLGASLHRPLGNIAQMSISYNVPGYKNNPAFSWVRGNLLTIDLRYFFPAEESSATQKEKKIQ